MTKTGLLIRELRVTDIDEMVAAYKGIGWPEKPELYARYVRNQAAGTRHVLLARFADRFAGYLTIKWQSGYEPFASEGIPEINDFSVLTDLRRKGIGTQLMDAAEGLIRRRSPIVGIGVGVTPDYGAAQRLYVNRGYLPDTRGLTSNGTPVEYGQQITVGDETVFYFTKEL